MKLAARPVVRKNSLGQSWTMFPTVRLPNSTLWEPGPYPSVVVLKGKWIEGKVAYGPGSFFYAPRNTVHGPHTAENEVISVTWYDGPLTVETTDGSGIIPGDIPPPMPATGSWSA